MSSAPSSGVTKPPSLRALPPKMSEVDESFMTQIKKPDPLIARENWAIQIRQSKKKTLLAGKRSKLKSLTETKTLPQSGKYLRFLLPPLDLLHQLNSMEIGFDLMSNFENNTQYFLLHDVKDIFHHVDDVEKVRMRSRFRCGVADARIHVQS